MVFIILLCAYGSCLLFIYLFVLTEARTRSKTILNINLKLEVFVLSQAFRMCRVKARQ